MSLLAIADAQISSGHFLGEVRIKPTSRASDHAWALSPRAMCVYNPKVVDPRTQGRVPRARSEYKTCKLGARELWGEFPARAAHIKHKRLASAQAGTQAPRAQCV